MLFLSHIPSEWRKKSKQRMKIFHMEDSKRLNGSVGGKEANLYCVIHHSSSSSEAHFFPVRPKKWIEWNEKKLNNHVWPVMEMRQG